MDDSEFSTSSAYQHQSIHSNNNNNSKTNDDFVYPPNYVQFVSVQGVWHRIPVYIPLEDQQNQSLHEENDMGLVDKDNSFYPSYDYKHATHISGDAVMMHGDSQIQRTSCDDLIDDDMAFLTSPDKVLQDLGSNTSCYRNKVKGYYPPPPHSYYDHSTYQYSNNHQDNDAFILPRTSKSKKPKTIRKRTKEHADFKKPRRQPIIIPKKRPSRGLFSTRASAALSSSQFNQEFVGVCGYLNINPYFPECNGNVSTVKGEEDDFTYFCCSTCGTRRRFMDEVVSLIQKK